MDKKKRGQKPKSGHRVEFKPSVEVWNILKDKPNKTAFIEESVLRNHVLEVIKQRVKEKSDEYLNIAKSGLYKPFDEKGVISVNLSEPMTFDTMKSDLNKLQEDLKNDILENMSKQSDKMNLI